MKGRSLSRRRFMFLAGDSFCVRKSPRAKGKADSRRLAEQTAVNKNLQQDFNGTLRAIAGMGYDIVEFSANTFMTWTPAKAKEVRSLLDDIHLQCRSTHNEIVSFSGDGLSKAIELNQILGSDTLVSVRVPVHLQCGPRRRWKRFSGQLSAAADRIRAAGMTLGFHNHEIEFKPIEATRPINILTANKDIESFHLNVALCLKGGGDPVAFIHDCPGRIQSLLIQDYLGKANWNRFCLVPRALAVCSST